MEFGHRDFTSPSSEQCVEPFRGTKQDFPAALAFRVKTLQAQGWRGRASRSLPYAGAGLREHLSEAEFAGLPAEYSGSLQNPMPLFLLELDGFRPGLRRYAAWNDAGAVAGLGREDVAFYRSTTA